MHKRAHRALVISNAAMVLAAHISLVTTEAYNVATLIVPLAIFAMAPSLVWLDTRTKAYRHVTSFITLCVAFFLFGIWLTRAAELIHIITWLVVYIQLYMMAHRKTVAYYYYLFLMSFFVLVSACSQEPEPAFALALGLFILSAIWALFALNVYAEALANAGQSPPDIVDSSVRGTIVPQQNKGMFDRNLYATLVMLCIASIFFTGLLFIATPRMEAGIFGASNTVQTRTDVTSEIDLNDSGAITQDPEPIMRVQFPNEPNGVYPGEKFWRITSLERYRNARWERFAFRDRRYLDDSPYTRFTESGKAVGRARTPNARDVYQRIFLDDTDIDGLPSLSFVRVLAVPSGLIGWDPHDDMTVVMSGNKPPSINYEAWSDVRELDEEALRAAPRHYRSVLRNRYAMLINHELQPNTVALAEAITRDEDNVYDKARAIEDYFRARNGFQYSLAPAPAQRFTTIDNFILETKTGHCEIFASAMALMLRSLGIPARLVSGYAGGEWSEGDGAYIVRKSMAHAWVEVYFIDWGWVTFDPSPPSILPEPTAWGRVTNAFGRYALNARMLWYREVIGFEGGIQWGRIRDAMRGAVSLDFSFLDREAKDPLSVSGFVVPLAIIWLAAMGVLGWGAFTLVAYLRRRAARRQGLLMSADQYRAQRVYARLKRRLAKLGADCAGKTSREVIELAAATPTLDPGPINNVIDAYNRARFGGYPMSRSDYQRLTGVIKRIRRAQN